MDYFFWVLRSPTAAILRLADGHDRGGAGLGPASPEVPGGPGDNRRATADDSRPRVRPLPVRDRRRHRGAAAGPDAAPGALAPAVHLFRSRHRHALEAAGRTIVSPLRGATYQTLIGLLAASGLRIGEAIKLDRSDVDWAQGVLLIRESKFGKSRLVPLHPSSMQALEGYAWLRDQLLPRPEDAIFFVSLNRKRLLYAVVQLTFRQLIDNAGIGAGAPSPPRLHDLRH
jgi:integrase